MDNMFTNMLIELQKDFQERYVTPQHFIYAFYWFIIW
jgi:hypothetical protein